MATEPAKPLVTRLRGFFCSRAALVSGSPLPMTIPHVLSRVALAAVVGALLWAPGCATAAQKSGRDAPAPAWVSLERTVRGDSVNAMYVVTLFENGRVVFEGHSLVKSRGTFAKTISAAATATIFREIESVNLWDREPRYDLERGGTGGDQRILREAPTDAPWDILTARSHGRFKRIDGLFFAPHELLDLKAHIEAAVGLAEWIGGPADPAR